MSRNKCLRCGLVNAASDVSCRRCGELLSEQTPIAEPVKSRNLRSRVVWIFSATLLLLFVAYLSLLMTSEDLRYDQRQTVDQAIEVLARSGFTKQAFVLKRLVRYRATDNWWNRSLGHRDAYAATNFPFEIVTLYPEFFNSFTDDNDRAAILLHESQHLFGSGEARALEQVWRNKQRLGWVEQNYGRSRVWNNTKELTQRLVPGLFTCGSEGKSDCTQ